MKIRGILLPSLDSRWLACYEVASDRVIIRRDAACGPLLTTGRRLQQLQGKIYGAWRIKPEFIPTLERRIADGIAIAEKFALDNPGDQYHVDYVLSDENMFGDIFDRDTCAAIDLARD
jgi:hypothetical protein